MASKRPIIGSLKGESAKILTESGGAVVVPPEDPVELLKAIDQVIANPTIGKNGHLFVAKFYNREQLAKD